MPSLDLPPDERRRAEIRRQYEVEKQLAARIRAAPRAERQQLYGPIYDEFFRAQPRQPQIEQRDDAAASADLTRLELLLLQPFFGSATRFLEVGSGDCHLTRAIAACVASAIAVEASEEIVSRLGDPPPNFRLLLSRDLRLEMADGSVDLAYSSNFIEHLHPEDAVAHVREVARVLDRGGRYVCVTPNRLYGPHDVSGYFVDEPAGLHLREYSHGDLARLFVEGGFRRLRVLRGVGRPPTVARLGPYRLAEGALDALPAGALRCLLRLLARGRRAPFRPLEQVILLAEEGSP